MDQMKGNILELRSVHSFVRVFPEPKLAADINKYIYIMLFSASLSSLFCAPDQGILESELLHLCQKNLNSPKKNIKICEIINHAT